MFRTADKRDDGSSRTGQNTRLLGVLTHKDETEVLPYHDSVRAFIGLRSQEVTKRQWTVLPHLPRSRYLTPSDYHLLGLWKDAVHGKKFEDNEKFIYEVRS
jgi:hypothetical protein